MRPHDQQQFEDFARATSGPLLRAAWLICGDRHRAEDLVQDTLARVYARWSRVREVENPVAYARTVMVRLAIDASRRRSTTEKVVAQPPERAERAVTDVDAALRHSLVSALRELAPTDRAVLVHRYLLDLDVATAAAELGLSEQAVRSRSSRALARVRELLGPDFMTTSGSGNDE